MNPGDLELYSSDELIEELLRRTTFQGVVIHAEDEARRLDWDGERVFRVRHNETLETEAVGRLLDVVSRHISVWE